MSRSGSTDFALFRRMLGYARPCRGLVAGFFALSLLSTPLALLGPVPLKIAVDSIIGTEPLPGFLAWMLPGAASNISVLAVTVGLLVAISVLAQLQQSTSSLLYSYAGEKLIFNFRARLFQHVQSLSLLYHDLKGTSDSTYRILQDAASIRQIALDGIAPFVTASLTLVSMIYIILRLDWQLALVALTVSPLLFVLTRIYRQRLRGRWRDVKKLESGALSVVQEVLSAIRVVKAFGQEAREQERFVQQSTAGLRARMRASVAIEGFSFLVALTTILGTSAVLYIGVRHVQTGTLTLGELLIVMAYLSALYGPLKTISKNVGSLQGYLASAERAVSLLDLPSGVSEKPDAKRLQRASGEMSCRNVSFAYEERSPVLRDISFDVPAGTRVGIAGKTGAGKTTLMAMLTRFYDPSAGQVLLDGVDLRDYALADLRSQFSLVLQDPVLFASSLGENIAYARPEASEEEIFSAARAANIHDFIVNLPEGYDTLAGERGLRLSGGERQRIALARAFLRDAPILILDEPTSAVDLRTEADIFDAMERLMEGRTTFVITHRIHTLEHCDLLLVIEDGRLALATSNVAAAIAKQPTASGGLYAVGPG